MQSGVHPGVDPQLVTSVRDRFRNLETQFIWQLVVEVPLVVEAVSPFTEIRLLVGPIQQVNPGFGRIEGLHHISPEDAAFLAGGDLLEFDEEDLRPVDRERLRYPARRSHPEDLHLTLQFAADHLGAQYILSAVKVAHVGWRLTRGLELLASRDGCRQLVGRASVMDHAAEHLYILGAESFAKQEERLPMPHGLRHIGNGWRICTGWTKGR